MVRKNSGRPSLPVSKAADVNPMEPLPGRDHDDARVPLYEMAAIDEFGRDATRTTDSLARLVSERKI